MGHDEKLKYGETVNIIGMIRYTEIVNYEPFEQAWLKRLSQFSTVIIFKTSDPKRIAPCVKFFYEKYQELREIVEDKPLECAFYLYKIWSGLYKVNAVTEQGLELEPVTAGTIATTPLAQVLSAGVQRIRALEDALFYIDQLFETRNGICAIFYGLDGRNDAFIKFIRNAVLSDEYYAKYHTVIVLTEDPEAILDTETLKYCIVVDIKPSTEEERRKVIEEVAKALGISVPRDKINQLVEVTRGLTLHELEAILSESAFKYRTFEPTIIQDYKYDIVRKVGIVDVEEPRHGFEAVGGYEVLKDFIRNNIIKVLRNPEKAKRLGLRPPRGILMFGPPGTGKTIFAKSLAKELGIPFLRLRTEKIFSKYVGETERNLAKAIEIAEAVAPCVFFIDEVDRFGKRAGMVDTDSGTSRRVFSMLLEWLGDDRRQAIVVATTNVPEQLDEAFIRVGRFDYIIPVLYPDLEARVEILQVHTQVVRKVPLAEDVDLVKIATLTEYWTGAELEELVMRACRFALQEDADVVEKRHFEKALATFRIDQAERQAQLEKYLKLAEKYCNDTQFLEQLKEMYTTKKDKLETLKALMEAREKKEKASEAKKKATAVKTVKSNGKKKSTSESE